MTTLRWFSSWVSGTSSMGSDVDRCIVVEHSDLRRRDRIPAFLPRSFPVGLDLFVFTREELERLRVEHPTFASTIDAGVEV